MGCDQDNQAAALEGVLRRRILYSERPANIAPVLVLDVVQDLYAVMFEDTAWSGEQMLHVESDAPLKDVGMRIETDRTYLVLQLSRVRDCNQVAQRREIGSLCPSPMLVCDS